MSSRLSLYHVLGLKLLLWYEGAVEMNLSQAPSITDSARIRPHDTLIIGVAPYPTLQQWPQVQAGCHLIITLHK